MSENIDVKIVLQAIDKATGDIKKVRDISTKASKEIQLAMVQEKIRLAELKTAQSAVITTTQRLSLEKLKLREATLKASSATKDLGQSKSSLNQSILSVKNSMMLLGGYMSGTLVKSLIDTQIKADNFERTLKVISGSTHGAGLEMQFLKDQSNRLGLELLNVSGGYSRLLASTKASGMSIGETRELFLGVAEAGASLGLSADQMDGTLMALQQISSKGKVSMEEMHQIGERIPGTFAMASKAMGLTTQQMDKLVSSGELMANDLLPKLAKEMRDTFGGGAVDGATSLNAEMNRFKNSMFDLKKAVLDSGVSTLLVSTFSTVAEKIRDAVESYNLWRRSMKDGEKETADNLKSLSMHMQTVMQETGASKKKDIGIWHEYKEAIKEINAITGKGTGEHFASQPREQQLNQINAVIRKMQEQNKIEKELLNNKKSELGSGAIGEKQKGKKFDYVHIGENDPLTKEIIKSEELRKKELESIKTFGQEKLSIQFEIDRMLAESQIDSRERDSALALISLQEKGNAELNEKAQQADYLTALHASYTNEMASIDKKWTEIELKNSEERKKKAKEEADFKRNNQFQIASVYISALKTMSGEGKKYALINKSLAMGDIIVNTARSVTQALSSPPGPPFTIPLSVAMGVLGGAQLAKASQVKYAAKGADFTTNGPQLMMVGENAGGRERVQVTPLSSPNINGPKTTSRNVSFGNININVNNGGDLISMLEKNPDRFNQLLKTGLKRGALSGVI